MRRWLGHGCAGFAALSLALGCAEAAECPREGGTLRVGLIGDVQTLDPFVAGAIPGRVYTNIFESLVQMTADGSLAPALATEWELIDGTIWRFGLREGVTFHS